MAILKKNAFSRRVPDLVTEELVAVLSRRASYEFKELFDIVHENLRARNAASGGEEMLRLRAYEKLQNLVARGAVKKNGKKYKGLPSALASARSYRRPSEKTNQGCYELADQVLGVRGHPRCLGRHRAFGGHPPLRPSRVGQMANLRGNHETESAEMRPYAGPGAPMLGAYLGCFAKDIACNELAGPGRSNSR